MDSQGLKSRVIEAFRKVDAPRRDQIAPHPCAECDELTEDLSGREPLDIPLDRLGYHRWDLPLLSASAKRYFLPAWIFRSIDDPTSDFTDALIMNLDSDHRQDGYTDGQKAVILNYLSYISARGDEIDQTVIDRAKGRWK